MGKQAKSTCACEVRADKNLKVRRACVRRKNHRTPTLCVLVSQPLLKIRGANLKLKNQCFIADISPGIFRVVDILRISQKIFFLNMWHAP